jgi:hypothetical protein
VPFLRQGVKGLGQERAGVEEDGQLPRPRLEQLAADRQDVADIVQAEPLVGLRPDDVLPDIDLEAARPSEMWKKVARPILRTVMIRPGTSTTSALASSSEAGRSPKRPTMSRTAWVLFAR